MKLFTVLIDGNPYITRPSLDDAERIAQRERFKGRRATVVNGVRRGGLILEKGAST